MYAIAFIVETVQLQFQGAVIVIKTFAIVGSIRNKIIGKRLALRITRCNYAVVVVSSLNVYFGAIRQLVGDVNRMQYSTIPVFIVENSGRTRNVERSLLNTVYARASAIFGYRAARHCKRVFVMHAGAYSFVTIAAVVGSNAAAAVAKYAPVAYNRAAVHCKIAAVLYIYAG